MENKDGHLIEHLEELRQRLIKTLLAFLFFLILAFVFVEDIYNWLIKDLDGKLALLGPGDILWIYMVISGVCAVAAVTPVAAYQTWRFVTPALTKEESRVALHFIPGLFLLFLAGLSFGYLILFPIVLNYLTVLSAGHFETMFTADRYFRFMLHLTLPFGFLFEMPLVVMFLTRLGIINPMKLAKARKPCYFALIVVAILITPPDLISDVLVIIPLLCLYEISITISKVVYRKRLLRESEVSVS